MNEKKDSGIIIENNAPAGFVLVQGKSIDEEQLDVLKQILAALEKK